MVYNLHFFLSSKCSLFHNSNVFGSCIIHILYTVCAKIKKKTNSGAKRLKDTIKPRQDITHKCPVPSNYFHTTHYFGITLKKTRK